MPKFILKTRMVLSSQCGNSVCHSPPFVSDYFSQCLIWSPIISGYTKHIFFPRFFPPKIPARPPKVWKSGFSSSSDYPVDGTLNLCHETLIAHEKESIWFDHSVWRKRPKRAKISVISNNCQIKQKYGYFGTLWTFSCYQAIKSNRFLSWAISVSWHKFRVPSTG